MRRLLLAVALVAIAMAPSAGAQVTDPEDIVFGPRTAVPRLPCQPGDRPETGLQGRVPPADIASGRAAMGYTCNMTVVGQLPIAGGATLDSFGDCAYYGRGAGAFGTQVVDVSDPARPVPTASLHTPAMLDPWESLKVNQKRKLLVAGSDNKTFLDIYDLSGDCRQPKLLSSTDMAPAKGHEGWFSPDGMTFFMSATGPNGVPSVHPVDIRDPAKPKLRAAWTFESQTHGASTTEDGARSYICQQQAPPEDALLIVDTSEIPTGKSNPQPKVIKRIQLDDNQWCQGAYRVTYGGHPYLIQYGERSGSTGCARAGDNWASFGYPRIYDLADERKPVLVSTALLEVHLPEHCAEVGGEGAINGLGYSVHHCSPDRLYNPTILACSWFHAGMRVLDIRDPHHPVEIGYVNPGPGTAIGTGTRPVVRAERKEIWFVNEPFGFHVVRFENDLWPFAGSPPCPEFDDYYFAQYNPGSGCLTATLSGIGNTPAPGGLPAAVARVKPRVTLRVSRRPGGRFRVTGRMTLPRGVAPAEGCRGSWTVTARGAGRTLVQRKLAIRSTCRFALTVKPRRTRRLSFALRFHGNARLLGATVINRAVTRRGAAPRR